MTNRYLLDTSALIAYIESEDGINTIKDMLTDTRKDYLSFISCVELYYVSWQREGEHIAKELIVMLQSLPVERVDSNVRITLSAGRLKAKHRLSVADAFVAATAIEKEAVLVHKDPELAAISEYVEIRSLP